MSAYFSRLAVRTGIQAPDASQAPDRVTSVHSKSMPDFQTLELHTEINAPMETSSVARRVSSSVQQPINPVQRLQQARDAAPTHAIDGNSEERLITQKNASLTDSEWQSPPQIERAYYEAEESITNENLALGRIERTSETIDQKNTRTEILQTDTYEPLNAFRNIHNSTHSSDFVNLVQTETQSGMDIPHARQLQTTDQHTFSVSAKDAYSESPATPLDADEKYVSQFSIVGAEKTIASLRKTHSAAQSNNARPEQLSGSSTEAAHEPAAPGGISVKIGAVSVEIHQASPKSAIAPAPRKTARPTTASSGANTVRLSRYYLRGI